MCPAGRPPARLRRGRRRPAGADDAPVELVDLLEAARAHQAGQHLAPDPARAVGDDGAALELVPAPLVELPDEVAGVRDVRHHGAAETADLRLDRVASVEEDHLVATLGD